MQKKSFYESPEVKTVSLLDDSNADIITASAVSSSSNSFFGTGYEGSIWE